MSFKNPQSGDINTLYTSLGYRVPHPFRPHRKGWSIALCATALCCAAQAHAQAAPCGLSAISETSPLQYPPIAKAAHFSGLVILIATFTADGSVTGIQVVSGPQMLVPNALAYVRGWKANPLPGTRNCPIVLDFHPIGVQRECDRNEHPHATPGFLPFYRRDAQHVTVMADLGETCYNVQYSTVAKVTYP